MNLALVGVEGVVEDAPVDPDATIFAIRLVTTDNERELCSVIVDGDLWILGLPVNVFLLAFDGLRWQRRRVLGDDGHEPVGELVRAVDLDVPVHAELVKASLANFAVETDALVRNAQLGLPLPLDGYSDLLRGVSD